MTTASWSPEQDNQNYIIEQSLLERFIDFSRNNDWSLLNKLLTQDECQQHAAIMKKNLGEWQKAAAELSSEEVLLLIRFFTQAEMQFSGWEAAEKSPVIWLVKVLKQRGEKLEKETLLWIRAHSDNRFLPNGPL